MSKKIKDVPLTQGDKQDPSEPRESPEAILIEDTPVEANKPRKKRTPNPKLKIDNVNISGGAVSHKVVTGGTIFRFLGVAKKVLGKCKGCGKNLVILLLGCILGTGCAAIKATSQDSRVIGIAIGNTAAANLAGLTLEFEGGTNTVKSKVGVESVSSEIQSDAIDTLSNIILRLAIPQVIND